MQFHGVDFTSSPHASKSIVVASGEDHYCENITELLSFGDFERWLSEAEGIIGIDAPFGFPSLFCAHAYPGLSWSGIAASLGLASGFDDFRAKVTDFKTGRQPGSLEFPRITDREAGGVSSIHIGFPPVGLMAARLLPILNRTPHSILPVRPSLSSTKVVEVYPGKLAKSLIDSQSYKEKKGTPEVRRHLMDQLTIELSDPVRQAAESDALGDTIDAVLAFQQVRPWFEADMPIPSGPTFELEGWIV
jgi:hypothetical protein